MVLRMKYLGFVLLLCIGLTARAQSYTEDFETYNVGSGIAAQSILWEQSRTGGGPGGVRLGGDAEVVDDISHEGDKAIFIQEASGFRNPATDVFCDFQNLLELGVFQLDFFMYIPDGNAAYFNLQGSQQNGNAVVFQFEADGNGTAYISDSDQESLANLSYTEDSWIKMSFDIDLVENEWIFLMNDIEKARFSNSYNALASLQFSGINYLTSNDAEFWIDDLSYSFEAYTLTNNNAQLQSATYLGGDIAGTEAEIQCSLRNLGSDEINSIKVGFVYKGILYEEDIEGLSLFTSNVLDYTFTKSITVEPGVSYVEVVILDVDGKQDDVQSDNTQYIKIKPIVLSESKVALIEAGASTSCGLCPSAYVATEQLKAKYGDKVVPIVIHTNDPMASESSVQTFFDFFAPTLPAATIDRTSYIDLSNPEAFDAGILEFFTNEPLATLQMGASYKNEDQNELLVTTQLNIKDSIEGEGWKIACALVELGYQNDGDEYEQKNDYFRGVRGDMGGFEELNRFIPGLEMVFDNVLRAYQPSFEGAPLDLDEVEKGDSVYASFLFNIDSDWNTDSLTLVSVVIAPDGSVDQAFQISLDDALSSGIRDVGVKKTVLDRQLLSLFPSPAEHLLQVRFNAPTESAYLRIVNIHGQTVHQRSASDYHAGGTLQLDVADLESGNYFLQVQSDQLLYNQQFQIFH